MGGIITIAVMLLPMIILLAIFEFLRELPRKIRERKEMRQWIKAGKDKGYTEWY